jgi:hypothetical protein
MCWKSRPTLAGLMAIAIGVATALHIAMSH